MKSDLILIVGASGTVGTELVKSLKEQGYRTRSTTSKPTKNGQEKVHVNLATGEGIKEAFEGVDRAFFLSPPGYADQYALLSPLIQEAKRRALKKVVLMTAMGANAQETPFLKAERDLEKSGLSYNIIRPNWFYQNFHTFWAHGIATQDKILLPAGNAKVSFIDARDIAATAAVLLTSDKFENQAFDLTGPESKDHAEVAAALSKVVGRKISYQEIGVDEFRAGLLQAGLPKDYTELMVAIIGFLREGYSERRTSSVKDVTGKSPRTLEDYANDYKLNFQK